MDDPVRSLIERLRRDSYKYYVPAIDPEDGAALAALAATAPMGDILDLGAGIGYSTAWLAAGARARPGARIVAVEYVPELAERLRVNAIAIREATGVEVEVVEDDALRFLQTYDGRAAMAFVDIEKSQYP